MVPFWATVGPGSETLPLPPCPSELLEPGGFRKPPALYLGSVACLEERNEAWKGRGSWLPTWLGRGSTIFCLGGVEGDHDFFLVYHFVCVFVFSEIGGWVKRTFQAPYIFEEDAESLGVFLNRYVLQLCLYTFGLQGSIKKSFNLWPPVFEFTRRPYSDVSRLVAWQHPRGCDREFSITLQQSVKVSAQ